MPAPSGAGFITAAAGNMKKFKVISLDPLTNLKKLLASR